MTTALRRIIIGLAFLFWLFSFVGTIESQESPLIIEANGKLYLVVTGDDGTPRLVLARVVSHSGDAVPDVPEIPEPRIPPTDPELDSPLGLKRVAYTEAMKLTAKQREHADGIARAWYPGTGITDHKKLIESTVGRMREVVGTNSPGWSEWYQAVSKKLLDVHSQGKLQTIEDYRVAWNEVVDGLEAVR